LTATKEPYAGADTFKGRSGHIAANIGRVLQNQLLQNVVQPSRS
jgi:hypothetical protein